MKLGHFTILLKIIILSLMFLSFYPEKIYSILKEHINYSSKLNFIPINELAQKYCKDPQLIEASPDKTLITEKSQYKMKIKWAEELKAFVQKEIIPVLQGSYTNRILPIESRAFNSYRNLFGLEPCRAHKSILSPLIDQFEKKCILENRSQEYITLIKLLLTDSNISNLNLTERLDDYHENSGSFDLISSNKLISLTTPTPVKKIIDCVMKKIEEKFYIANHYKTLSFYLLFRRPSTMRSTHEFDLITLAKCNPKLRKMNYKNNPESKEDTWIKCLLKRMNPKDEKTINLILEIYQQYNLTFLGFSWDELLVYQWGLDNLPILKNYNEHNTFAIIKAKTNKSFPQEGIITTIGFQNTISWQKVIDQEIKNIRYKIHKKSGRLLSKRLAKLSKMNDQQLAHYLMNDQRFIKKIEKSAHPPTYIDIEDFYQQMIEAEVKRIKYEISITPKHKMSRQIEILSAMNDEETIDFLKYSHGPWAKEFRNFVIYYYEQIEDRKTMILRDLIHEIIYMLDQNKNISGVAHNNDPKIINQSSWHKISWQNISKDHPFPTPKKSPFICTTIKHNEWKKIDTSIMQNRNINILDELSKKNNFISYKATIDQQRDLAESIAKCITGYPKDVFLNIDKASFIRDRLGLLCK